jgi:DeoR family fructose operon transcriptional repressor
MMATNGNLATEERLSWLRGHLDVHGRVRIADAAEGLGVSEMTVRRDLQELEAMGCARRVRGGAVPVGPLPPVDSSGVRTKAKARIATKLLPLIAEVGAMGMDASGPVSRAAAQVDSARDLTVVTNGLETFQALHGKPGITALLTGGRLDTRTRSLVGPLAVGTAAHVLLGGLLMSAAGVDPDLGLSDASIEDAEVKRAMASVSEMVVVAVDSSRLGQRGMAVSVGWESVDTLVTELDPGDHRLDPYRDHVAVL